jgi:3',5'-cyclic AMP phosphodiesterase CpdA
VGQPTKALAKEAFSFVQISESHIGFRQACYPRCFPHASGGHRQDQRTARAPPFILRTGDITQPSKPDEFDTAAQLLKRLKADQIFFVPGEHDVLGGAVKLYRERHAMILMWATTGTTSI